MSIVRIAHAEPRPGRLAKGEFHTNGHLVVLADDAGCRAVPIWLRGEPREDHGLTVSGRRHWTWYEVTARVPADADLIRFGIVLTGTGRIALRNPAVRNPELRRAEPDAGTP